MNDLPIIAYENKNGSARELSYVVRPISPITSPTLHVPLVSLHDVFRMLEEEDHEYCKTLVSCAFEGA